VADIGEVEHSSVPFAHRIRRGSQPSLHEVER
jgi:hypothetical protein